MKTRNILFFLAFAFIMTAHADLSLTINADKQNEMRPANLKNSSYLTWCDNGKSGKCFRMICPEDKNMLIFHHNQQLPILSPNGTWKITIQLKGTGKGSFGLLCYNAERRHVTDVIKHFTLESPQQWTEMTLLYKPVAGSIYTNSARSALPMVILKSKAEIWVDDFKIEYCDPEKGVKIDD